MCASQSARSTRRGRDRLGQPNKARGLDTHARQGPLHTEAQQGLDDPDALRNGAVDLPLLRPRERLHARARQPRACARASAARSAAHESACAGDRRASATYLEDVGGDGDARGGPANADPQAREI